MSGLALPLLGAAGETKMSKEQHLSERGPNLGPVEVPEADAEERGKEGNRAPVRLWDLLRDGWLRGTRMKVTKTSGFGNCWDEKGCWRRVGLGREGY